MNASRFAAALRTYLLNHSQRDLSDASHVERSVISRIATGSRRAPQDAARAILAAIADADCTPLLVAWLEDQIPDNRRGLVTIVAEATASEPPPDTDDARALAWLQHQLATNVHAIAAVVDMWRATGSQDAGTLPPSEASLEAAAQHTLHNGLHGDDGDPDTGTFGTAPTPPNITPLYASDLADPTGTARVADASE